MPVSPICAASRAALAVIGLKRVEATRARPWRICGKQVMPPNTAASAHVPRSLMLYLRRGQLIWNCRELLSTKVSEEAPCSATVSADNNRSPASSAGSTALPAMVIPFFLILLLRGVLDGDVNLHVSCSGVVGLGSSQLGNC